MTTSNVLIISVFCGMQVAASLLFKWGSLSDARWLWGFLGGNLLGFASVWLLMLVYRSMNPNVALGICGGSAFLLSQLALSAVFKSGMTFPQWGGVAAIVAGIVVLAVGKAS